jgi:hypothetical protein
MEGVAFALDREASLIADGMGLGKTVNDPTGTPTVYRQFTKQIQMMIDFPLSNVWSENGDSDSVVVDPDNNIVGLHFAHGFKSGGDPIGYGIMTPIAVVEQALGITFTLIDA